MSILTHTPPEHLLVRGEKCPIRTDFKTWLIFSDIVGNGEEILQKLPKIIGTVFFSLPPNLLDAIREVMRFYSCGVESENTSTEKANQKKFFDFEYDADLIYSAFLQQYHIDLCESNMHWWKFKALFNGLSEETQFMKVLQYRCVDVSTIKNKEQKAFYIKMKSLHKLPDNRSEEQKEQHINDVMEHLF